ncbi:MAG: APC family permease [Actinomycetota bacterium]
MASPADPRDGAGPGSGARRGHEHHAIPPGMGFLPSLKRLLLGRSLATEEAPHQLLPRILALPVFASDPLSSNAYATEEILIVLSAAGASSFWLVTPLAAIIATVVVIVIVSYRQTIRAYPGGGGSYIVARENLGTNYGLVAAAALLTDYVLTVSVSVAAGVAAIASAVPGFASYRVSASIGFVALLMIANLRGLKESGAVFAVPTYAFVLSIGALVVVGVAKCFGGCPQAASATLRPEITSSLSLVLILRAFASGSTALTGIEAVSNGVPAFRGHTAGQQARNAISTITIMGFLTLSMFLGISYLARGTRVHPITEEIAHRFGLHESTIVAQIADAVSGRGFLFFAVQATTAAILILAANTAYADFPRLSSILAKDRFMPRQFMNRGDRLVFSNGIVTLSILAAVLIWMFDASVTKLIQLYVVGVFTTFTLSQAGMVRRWRRLRSPRWHLKASMNGIGAVTTGIVLIVVAATKFKHGAWIVMTAIPLIVLGFRAIHRHYESVARQLRIPAERPGTRATTRVVVLVARMDRPTLRAIGYARSLRPVEVRGLHVGNDAQAEEVVKAWHRSCPGLPFDCIPSQGDDLVDVVRNYVRGLHPTSDEFVSVVIPERLRPSGWRQFIRRRTALRIKGALLFEPGVVVTDVPTMIETGPDDPRPEESRAIIPGRITALVMVSAVHNATLQAIAYARSLRPTELTALTFQVDADETQRVLDDWIQSGPDVTLEVIDSPYRDVSEPLLRHVRALHRARPDATVAIVLPEFVVKRWWHQFLHNQTALALKASLLFEPGVVVTSVPFHLD